MRAGGLGAVVVVIGMLVACSHDNNQQKPAQSTITTRSREVVSVDVVVPAATTNVGLPWRPLLTLPYGPAEHQLGRDHKWGPEFGAPDAGGTWWMLDTHKSRVAKYDRDGRFAGAVPAQGGAQMPLVLDDGTLLASAGLGRALLVVGGVARIVDVPPKPWRYSDGRRVYIDDGSSSVSIVNGEAVVAPADGLRTRRGTRFEARVLSDRSTIELTLPERTVRVRPLGASGPIFAAFEIEADAEDRFHLFLQADDNGTARIGYFTVDPTGAVSPAEPLRAGSVFDPGSVATLHVIPGSTTATVMFIDEDAVRIFQRVWP